MTTEIDKNTQEVNIADIIGLLPHRYPFILIDRVLEYTPGEHIVAIKNVTINEPFFTGHFPGNPVMPGVLILEALAQASVVLSQLSNASEKETLHLFGGIDKARFKQVVQPGDQLRLEATLLKAKRGIWKMHAEATVDGKLACSAELISAMKEM